MESELMSLLDEVRSLSKSQQIRVAAIMGALIADAAAQPIHWIYNSTAMEKAVSECRDAPEFLPVSANPYYCIPTGNQSPYGDELMVMLESLVECQGFNAEKHAEKLFQNFGPGSLYASPMTKLYKKNMTDKSMYPIQGKWQGFLLRRFSECYSKGISVENLKEEDTNVDPDSIVQNIPFVALLAGKSELLDKLQESILLMQTNDMMVVIVLAVSRIIERYILNGSSSENAEILLHPVEQVIQDLKCSGRDCAHPLDQAMIGHLKKVLDNRNLSVEEASMKFGVS